MVHQFINNQWQPGNSKRDGYKRFPDNDAAGKFFNDVTGKSGHQEADVVESLPDLLLKIDTIENILPLPNEWFGIAKEIEEHLTQQKINSLALLTVLLNSREIMNYKTVRSAELQRYNLEVQDPTLAEKILDFILNFMKATGQLDYIRRQSWFKDQTSQVLIDINYTMGRAQKLAWHKDTDGQNLFVSLIFNNTQPISSTEWTPDPTPLRIERANMLGDSWPPKLIEEIRNTKTALTQNANPRINVNVLNPGGFISWVDELIWHSSPSAVNRGMYTLDDAHRAITQMVDPQTSDLKFSLELFEVLVTVARDPNTTVAKFLKDVGGMTADDLDSFSTRNLLANLLSANPGVPETAEQSLHRVQQILYADASMIAWDKIQKTTTGGTSITNDGQTLLEQTNIEGRPRTMSDADTQQQHKNLPGNADPRNFLRLWVRVCPTQ